MKALAACRESFRRMIFSQGSSILGS